MDNRFIKLKFGLFFLLFLSTVFLSCSKAKSPIEPAMRDSDVPIVVADAQSNRTILAVYDASIDPVSKIFTVTPSNRTADYHFPLTQLCPNVIIITSYGFTPNFWADIKITHPLPLSGIDGFDPRVIAILPANPGVSMNYPVLNVVANDSVVLNPDGYTKLYDSLAGSIPGNANPFLAYFKQVEYRRWFSSGTGMTSDTRRWEMNIDGFGGPMQFKLVVDVSLNYPNQPQQVIDNAPETVQIDAKVCRGLTSDGGIAYISVTLLDWQQQSGIGGVQIESPDLFNGTISLEYSDPGVNPNEYVYTGTITNSLLATEGEYKVLVATWDQATGINLYKEFPVIVSDDGNLIWAKHAGGESVDFGFAITSLSDNSTVVTGYYQLSATFGPGEKNQTVLTYGNTNNAIFIARYNPDGTLAWAKRVGGTGYNEGHGITTLSDNSTVVTGDFEYTATFGEGEINETVLTSAGGWDAFIARYNPDGTLAWAKRAGGLDGDGGHGITTLSDNSLAVIGLFAGVATFGEGEPNETVLNSDGIADIFVAQYNPNGTLAWAKPAAGSNYDFEFDFGITVLSDNSTVIIGYFGDYIFGGTATFGEGEINETILTSDGKSDIFIARYNPNGTLEWAKRAGGSCWDEGSGIATLSDNSIVITGDFGYPDGGFATFGPGESNEKILWSDGRKDIFIAKYNTDGTLVWVKSAGGRGNGDEGRGITTLSDDSIVVTGNFDGSATFCRGETNETVLNSAGSIDIFTAKYNTNGTLEWAKRAGGLSGDGGRAITSLSDDSTVVTGFFCGSATFGPGESNQTALTSAGSYDIFVARFKP